MRGRTVQNAILQHEPQNSGLKKLAAKLAARVS
jgi:hypothetical protein